MATLNVPDVVTYPMGEECKRLHKSLTDLGEENGNPIPNDDICNCCIRLFITMGLGAGCLLLEWGDEKVVIKVLAQTSASQRKNIRDTYFQLYNQTLIKTLHDELSGDFRRAVILWTYDPAERDARLVKEALMSMEKGILQLQVIVEIACATSPHHLAEVRKAYVSLFERSIEEDIIYRVPASVRQILLGLVSSCRDDGEAVDMSVADYEASKLREAIELKLLNQDFVVWVLSTRNYSQLKATFECYKKNYGNPIDKDIKSYGKDILESVLKIAVWCIETPEKHFAKVIRASTVGFGMDEKSLTRVIVTRAEIDMMKVRGEYYNAYKNSIENAVIGREDIDMKKVRGEYYSIENAVIGDTHTSGFYQDFLDFLMTLLGAKI